MLWAATAAAIVATSLAPQQLVLAPKDLPARFTPIAAATGPTAPNAYRAAFAAGRTTRLSSIAVVFTDRRGAAAQVAAPAASCGSTANTRKLPIASPLGDEAILCESTAPGFRGYAVAWRHGKVFATVAVVGRRGDVSAALVLRLARRQEARIAGAAGGPLAA